MTIHIDHSELNLQSFMLMGQTDEIMGLSWRLEFEAQAIGILDGQKEVGVAMCSGCDTGFDSLARIQSVSVRPEERRKIMSHALQVRLQGPWFTVTYKRNLASFRWRSTRILYAQAKPHALGDAGIVSDYDRSDDAAACRVGSR